MSPVEPQTAPLILAVAPTGARRRKSDHPAIPITPGEIAKEARACADAGATLLHLHVRDERQNHSLDDGLYREAIAAVREETGDNLIVQVTTEAVGQYSPKDQMNLIRALRPEAFSISITELISDDNHEAEAAAFLAWAASENIHVQHILYSPSELMRFHALRKRGIISQAILCPLFVCGRYEGKLGGVEQLKQFLASNSDMPWMCCAFGADETDCAKLSIESGGHCRIGFENNLLNDDGVLAKNNADRVHAIAMLANELNRPIANIEMTRNILGVPRK
jgi:uncharacterized protein (DUF849 family)